MRPDLKVVRGLDDQLRGFAVARDEHGYRSAAGSSFPNRSVPWAPDIVVRCLGVTDVMRAVQFATEHGLDVAVRSGGVGWVGAQPGTLLVDLQDYTGVRVDPHTRTLRVEGGTTWLTANHELAPYGLAAASPQFPRLGVAGHVLGGGHGWLTSRLGWASDTLRAVEVVTADGRLIRASREHEPDLFWAMCGAGHNFGVVVALELDLLPLDDVTFGLIWFDPERLPDALHLYRDWVVELPDELTTIGSVGHPPAGWGGPAELEGRAAAHVLVCHCGSPEQAEHDLRPVLTHPAVVASSVQRMPWPELSRGNDVFGSGVHRISRMRYLRSFSDDIVQISERRAREMTALNFMSTHYYGGAQQRVSEDATAMSHRDKHWNYMVATTWTAMENGDPVRRWQDDYLTELAPHSHDAFYVNYLCDEPEHVPAAYNPRTWQRLRELKGRWDPTNTFRSNQNIPPASWDFRRRGRPQSVNPTTDTPSPKGP